MATEPEVERLEDDGYDEEADSDFDADAVDDGHLSSDSDEGASPTVDDPPPKRRRKEDEAGDLVIELDSGDEATLKEQRKARRKQKKKGEHVDEDSDNEAGGWRARTRAMRVNEQEEKRHNQLASIKGSTIDVEMFWERMNQSGPLPPVRMHGEEAQVNGESASHEVDSLEGYNKENVPTGKEEEMVTIKRKFQFAGEIHTEEKSVPKSSAEARLWLAQQDSKGQPETDVRPLVTRPLRKISRFDPNYNNLSAFKTNWSRIENVEDPFKGPKLNVVEKSKMDWAVHVDAEGLKDELDEHAKAKEGYHGRMDFLNQVEQRKEEEARLARMKR